MPFTASRRCRKGGFEERAFVRFCKAVDESKLTSNIDIPAPQRSVDGQIEVSVDNLLNSSLHTLEGAGQCRAGAACEHSLQERRGDLGFQDFKPCHPSRSLVFNLVIIVSTWERVAVPTQ